MTLNILDDLKFPKDRPILMALSIGGEIVAGNYWHDIGLIDEYRILCPYSGIYILRLANNQNHPITMGRFLHADKSGVLLIGKAKNVGSRLYYFYKSIIGEKFRHYPGNRLFLISMFTEFQKSVYADSRIQFTTRRMKDVEEATREEERLLKCYFIKFGELPPLNSELEDKLIKWTELDCSGINLW